jgi:methylated-DNA-[protein]-cysteine S-methyltransferase
MELVIHEMQTPLGAFRVALAGSVVHAAAFTDQRSTLLRSSEPEGGRDRAGVIGRFEAYFQGDLGALDATDVCASGTPFQMRVWAALRTIPTGKTMSYGGLARLIGAPIGASRAVGAANGANPIAIILPCHRVIGASGALTGYAGGISRKEWLLTHEGALHALSEAFHFGAVSAT